MADRETLCHSSHASAETETMLRTFLPTSLAVVLTLFLGAALHAADEAEPTAYDLTARLRPGDAAEVIATLEVGGDLLVPAAEGEPTKVPLSVAAKLNYTEQLLAWSTAPAEAARSLRRYSAAQATIKTDKTGVERSLPAERGTVVAELADVGCAIGGIDGPLTRGEFDLLDVVGNTLALDRLLPGTTLHEGDGWDHDPATIGALLGMDHVAVCEVRSVITGEENRQVQIRLAGTVQGTVDGAATEMELRAAYLYHLDRGRITKCNLAVKEHRKPGEVGPGLDVVAKLSVSTAPASPESPPFDEAAIKRATDMTLSQLRQLLVDAPQRGYRFRHDQSWFATAEQRELMSLRLLDGGELLAHCNVMTAPPRPQDKPQTLAEFEKEVSTALGDKVGKVIAATEWTTPAGNRCLGVIVDGEVNEVEAEWRYYNLSAPGMQQATVSVTVERNLLERFADADRPLVDSLELVAPPAKTAAAGAATTK
jgi:hypothetical protein